MKFCCLMPKPTQLHLEMKISANKPFTNVGSLKRKAAKTLRELKNVWFDKAFPWRL